MSWRPKKRLYRDALESYQRGFLEGSQVRLWYDQNPGKSSLSHLLLHGEDDKPAYHAGRACGIEGERIDVDVLPLDVWVRVLAKAQGPR